MTRQEFKMRNDTIEMRFASNILPHGFMYVNMGSSERQSHFQISNSLNMKVDRIGYKSSPRKYMATIYPIVEGVVKRDFPITTIDTEVHVGSVDADVEEMARILDYIGLDYENCTMDLDFIDAAQDFIEEFVKKYQTHRVE